MRTTARRIGLAALALMPALTSAAQAPAWPGWRGPQRDALSHEFEDRFLKLIRGEPVGS